MVWRTDMLTSHVTSCSEHVNNRWLTCVSLRDPHWGISRDSYFFFDSCHAVLRRWSRAQFWPMKRQNIWPSGVFYCNTVNYVVGPIVFLTRFTEFIIFFFFLFLLPFSVCLLHHVSQSVLLLPSIWDCRRGHVSVDYFQHVGVQP